MYKAELYKDAAKYFKKLDLKIQGRLSTAIEDIIECPSEGNHIKKLKGRLAGKYRYNVGNLRIVYVLDDENKVIYIEAIGPRGDVYK